MAKRRMFDISFIQSDGFSDLPQTARLLYFYLMAVADDDGFFTSLKQSLFFADADKDDFACLVENGFIIQMGNCYVIRHWRQHNQIQKDRYTPTVHQAEYQCLRVSETREYSTMDTECIQTVSADKNSIDKTREEKESIDKVSLEQEEMSVGKGCGETTSTADYERYCQKLGIDVSKIPKATLEKAMRMPNWTDSLELAAGQYKAWTHP